MTKRTLVPRSQQRALAVLGVASVLEAGVTVIDRDRSGGVGLSALPGATGQPAPTGPTGGSGGGSGGAPPFPMDPPSMPSGPPNGYNSGAYPAPDQGNGISIYNSGAPQSPSGSQGYQQAPNYPQQQLQPANGTQPPDYDAPLQTAAQPSVAHQPQYSQAPRATTPQQPEDQQPTPATGTPGPTSAPESSAEPTPTNSPNNDSDQEQSRDNYRCLNAAPVMQFSSMKGMLRISLTDGGKCPSCDTENPRENPNNCTSEFVTGVGLSHIDPDAEGGLESIMVYPTLRARKVAFISGVGVVLADTPPELKQLPASLADGSEEAFKMWDEVLCHAQASQLMSPADPSKSVYDRIQQNPDSIFQQYMCHFFGVEKKV